jgi:hypothetical protein
MAWKFIVITIVTFLFYSYAFAEGMSAWLNMNYIDTSQYENGKKTQTSDNLFQNYYLSLEESITPLISYQLYLRTTLINSHRTDEDDKEITTYQRAIEPAFDINLRDPVYGFDAGIRRLEQWSTANFHNDSRKTTEFYYSRLNIRPYELPSLSLQFDRQRDYDYLSPREIDTTSNRYIGSSWYDLLYKGLKASYNVTYMHNENKTPVGTISNVVSKSLNALYNLGYTKSLWSDVISVSAGYQGNYSRIKNEQFATKTGEVSFERTPSSGIYGIGTELQPYVDTLASTLTLSDNICTVPVSTTTGTINIGQNGSKFNNIGIQLFSSEKGADTLVIYVNKDVTTDTNLMNPINWRIYRSDFNQTGTWIEISLQGITISLHDALNNVYRYELHFSELQNSLFYRAINMEKSTINDVFVTEIEASGTDVIPKSGELTDTSTFFTQGINLNTNLKPFSSLIFSFNYFLNRADQEPESFFESVGGAFKSIFDKSFNGKNTDLKSNVMRTYGASTTWLVHRFLNTTVRYQRNESFDNKAETDLRTDTYSLTLNSSPLTTLNANFSIIRTYHYSFQEKQSLGDLYLLAIGSRLHRDVNMITDIGYTKTTTYEDIDSNTTSQYIRGILDARLTDKWFGNISYGYTQTSGQESSKSHDGSVILTYRPGKFISLSTNFKILDSDGDVTISGGLLSDWLFLPAIRLNAQYQYSRTEPKLTTAHILSGYVLWYITKFLHFQFNFNYKRDDDEIQTETYTFGGNLTCRLW